MREHERWAAWPLVVVLLVGAGALCRGADERGGDVPVPDGPLPVVAPAAEVRAMTSSRLAGGFSWMIPYIGYEPDLDAGEVPEREPVAAGTAIAAAVPRAWPEQLSPEQLDQVYALAGVPGEWRADLAAIAACESRLRPGAVGDGGNSLGLHQLWTGWFAVGEDPMDPVTNARVAVRVRERRGRFGGAGGWTCADLEGIE